MPTYNFRNTETGEEFEKFISISEKELFLKENANIQQIFKKTPKIISGVGDVYSKTDNTWKEVLSKIAEKHPNSSLADQYAKKSIKQIKTEQIFEKHLKRQRET